MPWGFALRLKAADEPSDQATGRLARAWRPRHLGYASSRLETGQGASRVQGYRATVESRWSMADRLSLGLGGGASGGRGGCSFAVRAGSSSRISTGSRRSRRPTSSGAILGDRLDGRCGIGIGTRASAVRFETEQRSKRRLSTPSTVGNPIDRPRAISALVAPAATSVTISSSRGAGRRRAVRTPSSADAEKALPPLATVRIDRMISSGGAVFERNPAAPPSTASR